MPSGSDTSTRKWLAIGIVGLSVLGIAGVSAVAILTADDAERPETSRLVFSSVLPLLGTWVGTVLAFYFARENLAAATESTLALQGRAEMATPVTKVMIPESDWVVYDLGPTDSPEALELSALHARMRAISPPSRRLPIRTASGAVLCVLHDSTLAAFAESEGQSGPTTDKTLGDLLAKPEFKELVEAIGFVPEKATVLDARKVMASIKNCNDVFVTSTGKRDDRAIGWLTNTLLAGVQ
jgi:hypothetical protein